ncbi:NEDD8 ultimate buster 1-like [Diadema antillarum]|uniref:NEDD8 ultimate buster 1-like n=1 Tax=Diadema antillarum TaxID=105358 RepID=UPI003A846160
MASNISDEQVRDSLRKKLNEDKIKLWLPPYTTESRTQGIIPEELIKKYSLALGIPKEIVSATLEDLRHHALDKLAARQRFLEEGIANLKIKLTGSIPEGVRCSNFEHETKIDVSSSELKEQISAQTSVGMDHLKLISCGRVLDDGKNLREQGLGPNSQVMVICLSQSEVEARKQEDQRNRLERTKEAAKILAKRNTEDRIGREDDRYFLQIADQTGRPIKLPDEERQALSVALTLNEKGRACLKRKQYGEALLILLEADQAFKQCRSEILQAVDNYAVLCLDIVWCYLCLQNVEQLPDAESRLQTCEDCFKRSYGENMERLTALKGDSSTELALYVRLYLLLGIVAALKNNKLQAGTLLNKAESILTSLQVDENKLMQLMSMGYDMVESRLGLRAAGGSVSHAVTKIIERRERKREIAEKEKEEAKRKRQQRRIGKTADGNWVKTDLFDQMVEMGFSKETVASALKQTNNDLHGALKLIQEHPELLTLDDDLKTDRNWNGTITDEMLAQVTELGFNTDVAREALRRFQGVVSTAVERLVALGGVLPPLPSHGTGFSSGPSSAQDDEEVLTDEQKAAIEEVLPDIPHHEEDYLDISLEEEASFIAEYRARIESAL